MFVNGHRASRRDPVDGTVWPHDTVLDPIGGPGGYGVTDVGQDRFTILGMQACDIGVEGPVEPSRWQPEMRLELFVPHRLACRHVPPPGAKPARVERQPKVSGKLPRPLLRAPQHGHVFGRADDRRDLTIRPEDRPGEGEDPYR